jgi:hypothetical protein
MKKILLLLTLFFSVASIKAQVSAYSFAQTVDALIPLSSPIAVATATGNANATSLDDAIFTVADGTIPFNFNFNGTDYTGFRISTNGFLTFGATAPASSGSTTGYAPISATTAYSGAIAAFGGDLNSMFNLGSTTGTIGYEVLGSAPNRSFVVEWKNFRPAYSTSTSSAYAFSFQIWLNEDKTVRIVYSNGGFAIGSVSQSGVRQIGLRGASNSDYNNRSGTGLFSSSAKGIANSNTQSFNTSTFPPGMPDEGLTYTFTPAVPCTGTPTPGSIPSTGAICSGASSGLSLSVSGYSTGVTGVSFQWEESDDNGVGDAWANVVGGSGETTTTYTTPVLAASMYYRCKVICANGGAFDYTNTSTVSVSGCQYEVNRITGATYTSIASTGTGVNNWSTTGTDDNRSNLVDIGFSFPYKGQSFTQLSINLNGHLTLGAVGTSSYTNSLTSTNANLLAPFWDDLVAQGNSGVTAGLQDYIKIQTSGVTPNRVFTVEWIGMEQYSYPGPNLNFQVKLHENGNIEYVYGTMELFNGSTPTIGSLPGAYTYSVGLTGPASTSGLTKVMALLGENVVAFGTSDPANMAISPECNSYYLFTPGTYTGITTAPTPTAPSNDESSTAITLGVNSSPCIALCGTYYTTKNATASVESSSCASAPDDDVWFKFTATTTDQTISVKGATGFNAVVGLYDQSLLEFGGFGCVDATTGNATGLGQTETINATGLSVGQVYYVRVSHNGTGSGSASGFSICVNEVVPPPANDDITGAVTITAGLNCSPTAGSTLNSTASPQAVCGGSADDDVWYQWVAVTPTDAITVESGAGFNAHVEVFSSSDNTATGTLTSLGCVNVTSTAGDEVFTGTGLIVGNTYFVRVYHSSSGTGTGTFTICATYSVAWSGATSTDWHTASNWNTTIVPPSGSTITILGATTFAPTISSSVNIVDLTIASGVILTNNSSLNVTGNLVNNGTIDGNGVVLSGIATQTLSGIGRFANLTLNNAAGATITIGSNKVSVTGTVTITSGTLTTNSNLILKSEATGTGRIAAIAGALTGNVTTEVFIPGGRRAYRFFGHPFTTSQSMSSLTDDIFVTGDGTIDGSAGTTGVGFDATTSNAPSSYWFDNTTNGWKAFMTATDASWTQYKGVRVLVRGDRTQTTTLTSATPPTPNAVTLDVTGVVNTGNVNINVPTVGNYHLISNPYPSPVNIGAVIDATANIGVTYWVWDANAVTKGAYVPLTVGSGAYNLAMNGAFFVQPTAGTTLAFTEANKTATATANLFRTANTTDQVEIQINYNGGYADKLFVRNSTTATAGKELAEDGSKLTNPDVNVYTKASGNESLTLDSRPIANNTIIPVGFTSTIQSNFEIALNNGSLIGLDVIIKDKFLNVEHTLTTGNPYSFAVTADAASQGENRFELVFRTSGALPTSFVTVSAAQQGNAIAVNFTTANEQNMSSYEVEESANGTNFAKGTSIKANNTTTANYNWLDVNINNGNNYYRIKAIEKNGVVKYSQVVNVRIGTKGAEFSVYPNPVKGGTVNVQLMNVEQGLYSIKIVNKLGQEIASRMITHNGGSATQSINIGNVASGTYNMVISNGTTTVTKTVIVD